MCIICENKRFVYCEQLHGIRRCMECNPPQADFEMLIVPDPKIGPADYKWEIAEAFAKCCYEVAKELDRNELRNF